MNGMRPRGRCCWLRLAAAAGVDGWPRERVARVQITYELVASGAGEERIRALGVEAPSRRPCILGTLHACVSVKWNAV